MPEIREQEPDRSRVVQIRGEHDSSDRRGSGYRVSDVVVLTAAHVVEGASAVRVVFNADSSNEWSTTAKVALRESTGDVALLELNWSARLPSVQPSGFGRLDQHGAQTFPCRAFGFPKFHPTSQAGGRRAGPSPYRGVRQADGAIVPRAHPGEGTLEVRVTQLENDNSPHTFPWDGMSGAAMWCADKIVGVVGNHQNTDGLDRVTVADVTSWYARLETDRLVELTDMLGLPDQIDQVAAISPEHARISTFAERGTASAHRHCILDAECERTIAESFVQPSGWGEASRRLADSRILLLRAEPGSGGRTAAIRLLHSIGAVGEPIHELATPRGDPTSRLPDPREVVADERLLLDLSAFGDRQLRGMVTELQRFGEGVRDRGAVLIVVSDGDEHLPTATVGRPDGGSVFRAQLAAHGVRDECPDPPSPQLEAFLDQETMAEIASLARSVRAARDRAGALGLADLIGGALAAHADRDDQVAALVARHPDGGSRSLLLASAMFEGHRAEEVLEAQRSMVRILDVTTEFEHEFEKASLTHRFSQVEAEVDGNAAVRFPRPGYAEAIRRHFWSNYPALRGGLQRWAVECGSRMFGPGDDGDEFARRFTDACFDAHAQDDVVMAINIWAFGGATQVALAKSALAYGLEDARTRWWFHRQCSRWASARTLPPQIAELVIPACVELIAPNHPGEAVVQLHNLSRNHDSRVAEAARSALTSLTDDRRVLRRLLARLITSHGGRLDNVIDRDLFLAMARPSVLARGGNTKALIAHRAVRKELAIAWKEIMIHEHETEYEKLTREWLDAHTVAQHHLFLDVLIEACGDDFWNAATLRAIGRRWSDQNPTGDRWRTAQELDDRLYTFCPQK